MKPADLVAEIRAYCAAHANPAIVQKYSRYFKEGYDGWGIDKDDPLWAALKQEWLERFRPLGLAGFRRAGESLFSSGKYEEGAIAIHFLASFREAAGANMVECLAGYFRAGIANWAHTDVLCGTIAGPMLAAGEIQLSALADWRKSELKFQRRAVPVSMLNLLKTDAPLKPLLEFLRPMMLDGERVVHQGLGWFLREAWKLHPKPVEAFLMEWKDSAARLIFQYATEKMTAGQRDHFRRVKTEPKKASKKAASSR
jgi:hypothetical protein